MLICQYCQKPLNEEILKSFIYKIIGTTDQKKNKKEQIDSLQIVTEYKKHFNRNPDCDHKFRKDFKKEGNEFIKKFFNINERNKKMVDEIKKILNL